DLGRMIPLDGGRFELRGCDPEKVYRLYFVSDASADARGSAGAFVNEPFGSPAPLLGAAVTLSPRAAGDRPVTVKLHPCGAVEFRCVDARGRPLRRVPETPGSWKTRFVTADGKALSQQPYLDLLVEPRRGHLGEERLFLAFPFRQGGYEPPFTPDKDGVVRLRGLIPGATYRLQLMDADAIDDEGHPRAWGREFSVGSGQTRRLPELVLPLSF